MSPVDPPASRWRFPAPSAAGPDGVVGIGADLEPGTVIAAYRGGLFPMPADGVLAWWSPDPRGILPLDGLHVSGSLRRAMHRFEVTVDRAFEQVVAACADPRRPGAWILPEVRDAYVRLHRLGWAHSVEAWTPDGRLAGGLYGVAVGGLFAGESMFHHARDASKVALAGLVDVLAAAEGSPGAAAAAGRILDVQWVTPHLARLGAVEVRRERYLRLLRRALTLPPPPAFAGG